MYKLGFVGAGKMAGAIIDGAVSSGMIAPAEIATYNLHEEPRAVYKARGFGVCESVGELASRCEYVVLSVKPQNFTDVLSQIKPVVNRDTVFISIAAGIGSKFIKGSLEFDAKVVLAMPNTPLLVGHGTTALCRVAPVSECEFGFVREIFAAAGSIEELPEQLMSDVIPISGSSPAYIYLFAKTFTECAAERGFDAEIANRMFSSMLIGAAHMMLESGKSHQELIDMVTSPKGTTLAGLTVLRDSGFEATLKDCFDATIRRTLELAQ